MRFPLQEPKASPLWHTLTEAESLSALGTHPREGLRSDEIAQRLTQYGPNCLPASRRLGPWLRFALQFHNPLIFDATQRVPGDMVLLESGARVPADLRLLQVKNLRVNEAALTGESLPSEKRVGAVPADASIGDRACMAYSGTVVSFGQAHGVVVATGALSEIGRISTLVSDVQTLVTPLTRRLDQFARQITLFILLAAGATHAVCRRHRLCAGRRFS